MIRYLAVLAMRLVTSLIFLPVRLLMRLAGRGVPPVIDVPADDPTMRAAMARARDEAPELFRRLDAPPPAQTSITVKVPLTFRDGSVEHVWLGEVRREGDVIVGTIDNHVVNGPEFAIGQQVRTPVAGISDWMAIEDGQLVAGYTLRVLREHMTPRQRAEFDRAVPFRIEDGSADARVA